MTTETLKINMPGHARVVEEASNDANRRTSPIVLAYLYLDQIEKREKKTNLNFLFTKGMEHIDQRIAGHPIFLNEQNALQYSRFMTQDHVILRAYVPEYLIEGHSQSLTLKKGIVQRRHIQSALPAWDKKQRYVENPYFDPHLLLQYKLAQKHK